MQRQQGDGMTENYRNLPGVLFFMRAKSIHAGFNHQKFCEGKTVKILTAGAAK
jgi:hypothetical protein